MKKNLTITIFLIMAIWSSRVGLCQQPDYQTQGVVDKLPVFYKKIAARQNYSLSWTHGNYPNFQAWRQKAKSQVMKCLMTPPPKVPYNVEIIAEQDRGSYTARKMVFNITGDSRILAYMLVPNAPVKHPAVLLLHDHGGKYDIGKEKVIEPWDVSEKKLHSAKDWVKIYYGNRFIGDELAKLGYVVFVTDMLNWSDRGGEGYKSQQELASNLMHLGSSYAGLIAYEDLYAAEFLSNQQEVDPSRIAAIGLSVGGFRTWQVAALSEHVSAGVSVCWMSTIKGLMVPGDNQTRGNSAFTMLHPGLSQYLDYPDVASIACPKPMMFLGGSEDKLFPVNTIQSAFTKMRKVWDSRNAGDLLVTKLYPAPHEFNLDMQSDAFLWLKHILHPSGN